MFAESVGVVSQPSVERTARSGLSRWSRIVASVCVGVVALSASAAPAAAQWRVGAFIGGEHESSWDEFLVIGADARGTVGAHTFEINPRFSYFIRDMTTRFQVDLNVLRPLTLAGVSRIAPYIGTGVAMERVSYEVNDVQATDSQTNIGFNYIMGASVNTKSRVQPYAQFVYTVLNDSPNNAVISAGIHIKLGQAK